jgi:superfamily II DNA or RNA helicase
VRQTTLFDVDDPQPADGPPAADPSAPGAGAKVITDRDYQIDATDGVFREWQAARSALVIMATGLGKTVVATRVCRRVLAGEVGPGGFLFFAHRDELITQAYDTFRAAFPERLVEVEKGTDCASPRADIVIASVQSLSQPRRLTQYRRDRFAAWCMDEAHHGVKSNATYTAVRDHFETAKGLGLTATPDRQDEIALGEVFDSVAFTYDILDGTNEGWLVPVGQRLERCEGLDLSAVRLTRDGDFQEGDLAEQVKKEEPLYALCEAAVKWSGYKGKVRPTLVFAASRDHAEVVAEILNRRDAKEGSGRAAVLHYKLNKHERREIIRQYKRGEIRYLTNFGILGEGFDDDETRVIVNGRPTRSRALFAQMFGRATRPLREILPLLAACRTAEARRAVIKASRKPGAIMIDLMGVNHKLVLTMADILGGRHSDDVVQVVRDRLTRADEPVDVEAALEIAQRQKEREDAAKKAAERRSGVAPKVRLAGRNVDPFDVLDAVSGREPGYMAGKAPTKPQLDCLRKFGIPEPELEELTRHKASRLIDACMNRRRLGMCSFKVARILRKHGYDPNMTAAQASDIIAALKANRWRRPT